MGQGGPALNAVQMQQPQHAQMQENQNMGQHQNMNINGPRPGNRLINTVPLCWVLLRCRGPCHVPFVENGGCWVYGRLPVAGTAAQPPEMGTVPATGSLSATQQPPFSTKWTWQGPRQRSRNHHNGTVSTRRLPRRGPMHATPATAATTAGRISTATTNEIR